MIRTLFERRELKFVVSAAQRAAVEAELERRLAPDPYGDETGRYPTVDLYFDSPGLDAYWERWRGQPSRRKLRLRVYGGAASSAPPAAFLEIKHSLDGRICKRRVALSVPEALAVCRGEPPPERFGRGDRSVVAEVQAWVRSAELAPVCMLRCERRALVGEGSEADLRVTFDENVAWRARDLLPRPDDRDMDGQILGRDPVVLEVKVDTAVPTWLSELLTRERCLLQGHSKYSGAVVAAGLLDRPAAAARPPRRRRGKRRRSAAATVGLEAAWTR
jgi:hypothetical protein